LNPTLSVFGLCIALALIALWLLVVLIVWPGKVRDYLRKDNQQWQQRGVIDAGFAKRIEAFETGWLIKLVLVVILGAAIWGMVVLWPIVFAAVPTA
jgi:hypothetical protein